ncbi:TPA: hypothetical protein RQN15_002205 [Aeromonas hydrophila]|nr:hypothetical protein [Aeromonas hydrophila]
MNEMLDGKLVTKESLVNHFIESNDSLDGFIALVKEAFKEAEEKRKDSILEKLELFAIENNMSLEQVKAIFAPKSEEKTKATAKSEKKAPNRSLMIFDLEGKKYGVMRGSRGINGTEIDKAIASGQTKEEMKARGQEASEGVKARVGSSTKPVDISDLIESA